MIQSPRYTHNEMVTSHYSGNYRVDMKHPFRRNMALPVRSLNNQCKKHATYSRYYFIFSNSIFKVQTPNIINLNIYLYNSFLTAIKFSFYVVKYCVNHIPALYFLYTYILSDISLCQHTKAYYVYTTLPLLSTAVYCKPLHRIPVKLKVTFRAYLRSLQLPPATPSPFVS